MDPGRRLCPPDGITLVTMAKRNPHGMNATPLLSADCSATGRSGSRACEGFRFGGSSANGFNAPSRNYYLDYAQMLRKEAAGK